MLTVKSTDQLLKDLRVLVVDDDPETRELLGMVLRYHGALVTIAASAHDGLAALQRVIPDLLISDISMPGADGYWLISQVRALPRERGGGVPAVAVTALGGNHGSERSLASGFQGHVRKPVDTGELARLLAGLVGRC